MPCGDQAIAYDRALYDGEAQAAIDAGQLAPDTDARELAYQLNALALAANQVRQLLGDDAAVPRSRRLMLALIGA